VCTTQAEFSTLDEMINKGLFSYKTARVCLRAVPSHLSESEVEDEGSVHAQGKYEEAAAACFGRYSARPRRQRSQPCSAPCVDTRTPGIDYKIEHGANERNAPRRSEGCSNAC
jgi:hypothetical protein